MSSKRNPGKPTLPKKKTKRTRSTAEKFFIIAGILIAISMVLSLVIVNVGF